MAASSTTHHGEHAGHGHDDHEHHVIPIPVYLKVFAFLMVLLIATLGAAMVDLGPLNLPIAMVIAVAKAAAVVLYFMHVKFNSRLTQLFAGMAFIWLVVMFLLTFADYASRNWPGAHPG